MYEKPIYGYVYFGTAYEYLRQVRSDLEIHDPDETQGFVLYNLRKFVEGLNELDLQVTARAATAELLPLMKKLVAMPKGSVLSDELAEEVRSAMQALRVTLVAELQGFKAYLVTPKRLDIAKLLKQPRQLFAADLYDKLPTIAQYDFAEGGKCVAFERTTAAAFHLLRGTEAVLKTFYCHKVRQKRCSLMWGPMITSMRSKKNLKGYSVLLDNLDNIRRSFRNPTQHPEMTYDIEEVQDLLGLCVDVVNRMARDLP
jgi:hypothetical protein